MTQRRDFMFKGGSHSGKYANVPKCLGEISQHVKITTNTSVFLDFLKVANKVEVNTDDAVFNELLDNKDFDITVREETNLKIFLADKENIFEVDSFFECPFSSEDAELYSWANFVSYVMLNRERFEVFNEKTVFWLIMVCGYLSLITNEVEKALLNNNYMDFLSLFSDLTVHVSDKKHVTAKMLVQNLKDANNYKPEYNEEKQNEDGYDEGYDEENHYYEDNVKLNINVDKNQGQKKSKKAQVKEEKALLNKQKRERKVMRQYEKLMERKNAEGDSSLNTSRTSNSGKSTIFNPSKNYKPIVSNTFSNAVEFGAYKINVLPVISEGTETKLETKVPSKADKLKEAKPGNKGKNKNSPASVNSGSSMVNKNNKPKYEEKKSVEKEVDKNVDDSENHSIESLLLA